MKFRTRFPSESTYRWDMPECFAYDGIKKIGAIDGYQCGIFERVKGWLEGLGIHYTVKEVVGIQ